MILAPEHLLAAVLTATATCGELDQAGLEPAVAEAVAAGLARYRDEVAGDGFGTAAGRLGMLLQAHALHEAAAPCYRIAGLAEPGDLRWAYLAGVNAQELGDLEDAASHYWAALRARADYLPAAVRLADALRAAGDLAGAGAVLARFDDPAAPPELDAALGEQALAEGRFEKARGHLERAVAARPDASRLDYLLARALRGLGDETAAREALERSGPVGLVPADPLLEEVGALTAGEVAPILAGRRAYGAGDLEAARASFETAVARNPGSIEARVNLATTLAGLGEREAALEAFEEVIGREPDNRAALFNLAALDEAVAPGRAIARYQRLVAVDPRDFEARYRLGRLLAAAGRRPAAREQLEASMADLRYLVPASLALSDMLVSAGEEAAARAVLEDARALAPTDPELADATVVLLSTAGDRSVRDGEAALALARRMHAAMGASRSAQLLALAHAELGDCEAARRWLGTAIGLEADAERARALTAFRDGLVSPCRPG